MSNALKLKIKNNEQVTIAIMGNSIGCGFRAENTYTPNPYNTEKFGLLAVGIGTDANNRVNLVGETDIRVPSWTIQLHQYLKTKNANSTIRNVSINGGKIADHISTNSIGVLQSRTTNPDAVILPLQINDALSGDATYWMGQIRSLIDLIFAKGWLPVLMKENDIYDPIAANRPYFHSIINHVDIIADEYNIEVIDAFAPFKEALDLSNRDWLSSGLFYDSIHPNQAGHDMLFASVESWLKKVQVNDMLIKKQSVIETASSILVKSGGNLKPAQKIIMKL